MIQATTLFAMCFVSVACALQVGSSVTGIFCGLAFDVLHLNVHQVTVVTVWFALLMAMSWLAYACQQWRPQQPDEVSMSNGDCESGSAKLAEEERLLRKDQF